MTKRLSLPTTLTPDPAALMAAVDNASPPLPSAERPVTEQVFIDSNQPARGGREREHLARYEFAARHLPACQQVLDCACGSGYGAAVLAMRADRVVGVDNTPEAIKFARRHFGSREVTFHQGDMTQLRFAANVFDGVVSLGMLEQMPREDATEFLRGIIRWLNPGGVMVISFNLGIDTGADKVTRRDLEALLSRCVKDCSVSLYRQQGGEFTPLQENQEGVCVVVARKHAG